MNASDPAVMHDFQTACEQAARAGGAVLLDWAGRFSVREKGPADLVTEADEASQQVIRKLLLDRFPEHHFLGEEGPQPSMPPGGYRWIVDPLDGTTNYVHGLPQYAVSVALECNKALLSGAVFDPVANECFTAAAGQGAFLNGRPLRVSAAAAASDALVAGSLPPRLDRTSKEVAAFVEMLLTAQSVRRMGSTALNLCYVAAGRFDGTWATETKSWDVAAGVLLVREAGGIVTAVDGRPFDIDAPRFLASSTRNLHTELLLILARALG